MTPAERIEHLAAAVIELRSARLEANYALELVTLNRMSQTLADVAADAVADAMRSGMTQREAAHLLGISESALRGARKEYRP